MEGGEAPSAALRMHLCMTYSCLCESEICDVLDEIFSLPIRMMYVCNDES